MPCCRHLAGQRDGWVSTLGTENLQEPIDSEKTAIDTKAGVVHHES
jgi:hypothetical protein